MGDLLGDITPSWASAPVMALLANRGCEARLAGMSWRWVSSRTRGSGVAVDTAGPASADTPPVVNADAKGDDDPTQPFLNVDGVDPSVSDPWRPLEAPACAPDTLVLAFPDGNNSAPRGGNPPTGDSPSNPTGVSRIIQLGVTCIYEFDAETPIGGHVEDSPAPVVILGRGE